MQLQTVGARGYQYQRYVPPSTAKSSAPAVQYFDDAQETPQQASPKRKLDDDEVEHQSPEPKAKKPKNEKKVKSDKKKEKKTEEDKALRKERKREKKEKKVKKGKFRGSDYEAMANSMADKPVEDEDVTMVDVQERPATMGKTARHKTVLDRKTKSLQLAETVRKTLDPEGENEDEDEPMEFHDLEPLPQPKIVPDQTPNPTYDTLPPWLSKPIHVSQSARKPFSDLGLSKEAMEKLAEKERYSDAFAVQTAVIPLLLPTAKRRSGDLLVQAPTGSGKTLAYALPIVRDISQGCVTRLRALVVLPTRDLVKQAKDSFEIAARAFEGGERRRVRIGTAMGSQTLKSEQEALISREQRYDPDAYKVIKAEQAANRDPLDLFAEPDPRLGTWEGDVVDFMSKVDILICTPGRLVEHIEHTPDYLDYVRWLVVDEADKLLAQSYQGWLDTVLAQLSIDKFTRREFSDFDYKGPRKIILSATLTRDLSVLEQLKLQRPKLIVVDDGGATQKVAEHSLPAELEEYAIRVHDIQLRPLYLLDLLRNHMKGSVDEVDAADAISEATSDTSSDDSDSSSDTSDSDSEDEKPRISKSKSGSKSKSKPKPPISLIFTGSNEDALRLARLLAILDADLAPHIGTITSTTPTHMRRKILQAFTSEASPIRLLIASDLVSRGIDLPKLEHVINYDVPLGVEGYVHRVGRTARAGRRGQAFTLVGDDDSERWFWGKVLKNPAVRRARPVARVQIERQDEKFDMFEEALTKLGEEARKR